MNEQCQIYREQVAKVLEAMNHMHMNETVTELTESCVTPIYFP